MAAKRSRVGRPSSSGDTTVLTAPIYESNEIRWPVIRPPPGIGTSIPIPNPSPVKIRPLIFTFSAPVCGPVERMPFGAFLEKCCYCRKKIAVDDEVFMSRCSALYAIYKREVTTALSV
uniref:FLZ-type domain-containing protein n=1 Tax=Opuntia streptacantha TaxID=393608 RepID=A0A7C9A7S6_OPUST